MARKTHLKLSSGEFADLREVVSVYVYDGRYAGEPTSVVMVFRGGGTMWLPCNSPEDAERIAKQIWVEVMPYNPSRIMTFDSEKGRRRVQP